MSRRCPRTLDIVATLLDRGSLDAGLGRHVPGCSHCQRARNRLPTFERRLGEAVRPLADVPLPTLAALPPYEPLLPGAPWPLLFRRASAIAAGFFAVAVVAAVLTVGLLLRDRPSAGGAGGFPLDEAASVRALAAAGYLCDVEILGDAVEPVIMGPLCALPLAGDDRIVGLERGPAGIDRVVFKMEPGSNSGDLVATAELVGLAGPGAPDLPALVDEMTTADGGSCGCRRSASTFELSLEGDRVEGYVMIVGPAGSVPDPLVVTPRPSGS